MPNYIMAIYDQCGLCSIIDLGISVDEDDDNRAEAEELALVMARLPYECNPLPSGGMGFGTYQIHTREDLQQQMEELKQYLDNWENEIGFEGVRLGKALLESKPELGSKQSTGRYDYPKDTGQQDWDDLGHPNGRGACCRLDLCGDQSH